MATSNSQTQKPFSLLLPISLTFFLLFLNKASSTESVSFSFSNFDANQENLILQGDALVSSTGKLQLTKVEDGVPIYNSLGRALYSAPIRIYDSTTGYVAKIITSFSFIIDAPNKTTTADGLAFFLGAVDTQPKGKGGFLGLFSNQNYNKSNQIVAVEFDTFINPKWDPQNRHIGINVNSIKSTKTASWGLANGQLATVLITYIPSTQLLTASLVHPSRKTSYIVTTYVDLKSELPEYVRVGFSATTGYGYENYVETHDILSWSFESELTDPTCSTGGLGSNAPMLHYSE